MRKQPVTVDNFWEAVLPRRERYPLAARYLQTHEIGKSIPPALIDRSAMGLSAGPLRPDDENAWKAVAKNCDVTNKITYLENGYWGIIKL